jgi:hypothetical protein
MRQSRLNEGAAPLVLAPPPGEPELPGMAEWRAKQKRAAAADLLTRELASFEPAAARDRDLDVYGSDGATTFLSSPRSREVNR